MGWRLPDGNRVKATFEARFVSYEEDKDRWVVVFERNLTDLSCVDAQARALIEALAGLWAYVPSDARNGITLPLKYETLTGRIRFFYKTDPRLQSAQNT
jgi:hypothetical protein